MISRRYGCLPSEIVKLSPADFGLNLLVLSHGMDAEIKAKNSALAKARRPRGK